MSRTVGAGLTVFLDENPEAVRAIMDKVAATTKRRAAAPKTAPVKR